MKRRKLLGYMLLGSGITLLLEHVYLYGYSWEWSLQCHGLYGVIGIFISFLLLSKN